MKTTCGCQLKCPMHAAAPVILEALREARDFISALLGNNSTEAIDLLTNHGEDVEGRASAAIAQAEGEREANHG